MSALEELAREEEYKLRDRWHIGYVSGLKSGVLLVRTGSSFEDYIADVRDDLVRSRDAFDLGRLDGLLKAQLISAHDGQ